MSTLAVTCTHLLVVSSSLRMSLPDVQFTTSTLMLTLLITWQGN